MTRCVDNDTLCGNPRLSVLRFGSPDSLALWSREHLVAGRLCLATGARSFAVDHFIQGQLGHLNNVRLLWFQLERYTPLSELVQWRI